MTGKSALQEMLYFSRTQHTRQGIGGAAMTHNPDIIGCRVLERCACYKLKRTGIKIAPAL